MSNFDTILAVVDKYLRKYSRHYLYEDLRSETIVYMAQHPGLSGDSVLGFARKWLRQQSQYASIADIDQTDEAEHPKIKNSAIDLHCFRDEIATRFSGRQREILEMMADGNSSSDIAKHLQVTPRVITYEIDKIKKQKNIVNHSVFGGQNNTRGKVKNTP